MRRATNRAEQRMDNEEYAGFLKLWLTKPSDVPELSPEVRAYLRYLSQREPLSEDSRRAIGFASTDRAA